MQAPGTLERKRMIEIGRKLFGGNGLEILGNERTVCTLSTKEKEMCRI